MTSTGIIDISNVLSTSHRSKRKVKHELTKIKVGSNDERGKLFDLIAWINTDGKDIIELVKIVMNLVNPLETGGASKKKEAKFLFVQVLKVMDVDEDDMEFYIDIFDSAVEVIIWAKKGGLDTIIKKTGGCFPCRKKK